MYYLTALLITAFSSSSIAYAESQLLESVKRNPKEAIALCSRFSNMNSKGMSSYSKQATATRIFSYKLRKTVKQF